MSEAKKNDAAKKHLCPNCKKIWDCNYDDTVNMPYEMLDLRLCKPARKRKAPADCGLNKSIFNFSIKFGY